MVHIRYHELDIFARFYFRTILKSVILEKLWLFQWIFNIVEVNWTIWAPENTGFSWKLLWNASHFSIALMVFGKNIFDLNKFTRRIVKTDVYELAKVCHSKVIACSSSLSSYFTTQACHLFYPLTDVVWNLVSFTIYQFLSPMATYLFSDWEHLPVTSIRHHCMRLVLFAIWSIK